MSGKKRNEERQVGIGQERSMRGEEKAAVKIMLQ